MTKATKKWVKERYDEPILAFATDVGQHQARIEALEERVGVLEQEDADVTPFESRLRKLEAKSYDADLAARGAREFTAKAESWAALLETARKERDAWKRRADGLSTALRGVRSHGTVADMKHAIDVALSTGGQGDETPPS